MPIYVSEIFYFTLNYSSYAFKLYHIPVQIFSTGTKPQTFFMNTVGYVLSWKVTISGKAS